jgi:NAD(P)-dependent dehydrogenase (short-subunit alcohol dehydrogenase family)
VRRTTDFSRSLKWRFSAALMCSATMALNPLRRSGEGAEIACAAVVLALPAGAFTTGQALVVDGGTLVTGGR